MTIPSAVDLRISDPLNRGRIWDRVAVRQYSLDDCTSIALAGAVDYLEWRRGNDVQLSNVYLHMRAVLDHPGGHPDRAAIEEELEVLTRRGICRFGLWPYRNWDSFGAQVDDDECDRDASSHRIRKYERLARGGPTLIADLRARLAAGFPVVFGYHTYTSGTDSGRWYEWAEGWTMREPPTFPVPLPGEPQNPGSLHDVMAFGYDDAVKVMRIRNSLSPGHFLMPYAFILAPGATTDFYVITELAGAGLA